jgi:hypothetical protein
MATNIFEKIFKKQSQLRPSAMATVAQRRFDDAESLRNTGQNARANGVAYLAGFVIEILLKARLVQKFPAIASRREHQLRDDERGVWSLIWRQHNLEKMLSQMPELEAALKKQGERAGRDYVAELKKLCATWTIQARYSPRTILMDEAGDFLDRVRELKEKLK